jgi:EmrB/QacA subfamily drug resistance transporter
LHGDRHPNTVKEATPTSSHTHLRATLILCCLAQFMVVLDVSVVNVALPAIRNTLHFTEQDLQWVVNAYTVAFAGFLLLGGRAADLLGRRRVFVSGLTLFALASLAGGFADSRVLLIAARAAQGLGGAVVAPASLTILSTTFAEGPARNRAVGVWGAMGGAGGAAGVLLGGLLTDLLSWRWILFINVPIGLTAALLARHYIAEGRIRNTARRRFDLAGALSATLGLSVLVLGIVRTDVTGWSSASTLALIAAGLVLLAGFLAIEGRFASDPLLPLRIYRSRTLSVANVAILVLGASTFAMWFFLSLYLQQVMDYSPLRAGVAFLPMTVCIVACTPIASRLVTRVGPKPLIVFGLSSLALGLFLFTGLSAGSTFLGGILGPSLLAAIGMAFTFVPVTIAAVSGVAPHEAGLASGLVNTSRLFGGALGLAVLAALATARTNAEARHLGAGIQATHVALTHGFVLAFALAGAFAAFGALASLIGLPAVRPRARSAQTVAVEGA